MRVSVLIPVFNKAPYLRECLDSVYAQTFKDFEIIAVDDRSTDDSLAILKAETDPRLRIIALAENRGPGGAANAGLDACRGEYIVRLDADDLAVPERIQWQVAFMDAHPEVGASSGALRLFGDNGQIWRLPLTDEACKANLLFGVPVSQGASILRRSVVEAHRLRYDAAWPRVGEDWLFWTTMAPTTQFGNIDQVVTLYRRGEQNISHGQSKVATHRVIMREVFNMLGIDASEKDVDTHLMALTYFAEPPDPASVRRLRDWLDHLLLLNAERGLFPKDLFRARVERAWKDLFYRLPAHGVGASLQHLRSSGQWPMDRALYLFKVQLNKLFGRNVR